MRSRFVRSATRSGWRGVALLGLLPVAFAAFGVAFWTHGTVRSVAGDVYITAAAVILVLAWQISFGGKDA
jgi:hypothetical protein